MTAETTQRHGAPGDPLPGEVDGWRVPVDGRRSARPVWSPTGSGPSTARTASSPAASTRGGSAGWTRSSTSSRPGGATDTVVTLPDGTEVVVGQHGFGRGPVGALRRAGHRCDARPTSCTRTPRSSPSSAARPSSSSAATRATATARPASPARQRRGPDRAAVCRGGLGRARAHHRRGAAAGQRADRAVPDGGRRPGRTCRARPGMLQGDQRPPRPQRRDLRVRPRSPGRSRSATSSRSRRTRLRRRTERRRLGFPRAHPQRGAPVRDRPRARRGRVAAAARR